MDEAVEVIRHETPTHGAYRVDLDGATAELTWRAHGNVRSADHTFVPPAMRGRGIAGKLVDALVADARAQGFKIDPRCSYVEAAFRHHPEWADLRAGGGD